MTTSGGGYDGSEWISCAPLLAWVLVRPSRAVLPSLSPPTLSTHPPIPPSEALCGHINTKRWVRLQSPPPDTTCCLKGTTQDRQPPTSTQSSQYFLNTKKTTLILPNSSSQLVALIYSSSVSFKTRNSHLTKKKIRYVSIFPSAPNGHLSSISLLHNLGRQRWWIPTCLHCSIVLCKAATPLR